MKKLLLSFLFLFFIFLVFFQTTTNKQNDNTKTLQDKSPKLASQINITDSIIEPPAVCFAPGTDPSVVEEYYASKKTTSNSLGHQDELAKFNLGSRWSFTAINGGGLGQGDITTLTWSYVPDGTPIGNGGCGVTGESTDPSDFIAFFNGIYGPPTTPGDFTTAPWHDLFVDMFDTWSSASGLIFVYEPNDDGVTVVTGGSGITGTRGDLRISGHPLDGNSGVLACNYFPNNGDMIIDTSDNFYSNNPGVGTINVLTHEIGHGLGIQHVCPIEQTKLMEPFVTTAFQGPQEDDILATNRAYGDPEGVNDTPANATFLGANPNPTSYTKSQRSIDDDSDIDYFSFTISESTTLNVTLSPTGTTYLDGVQFSNGSCSAGTSFNALTVADLMLEVLDSNGTSIIATSDTNGLGEDENIIVELPIAGTYYVRVQQQGANVDNVQMYDLNLNMNAGVCTAASVPTNLQASDITDTSALISWDAQSNVLYDLRYRENGASTWILIEDIVASNTSLSGLSSSTEYEVQVRSKCPEDTPSAYSSSLFFTTEDIILVYCDSSGNSQADEYIGRVQFADIDNSSADENGGYSDFTNISTSVVVGEEYIMSITPTWTGGVFSEGYAVWIDYNQNGDFTDAGELVFSQSPTTATPVSGNINIPISALEGPTRMRVSMKWNDIPDPCENFAFGEVEDYTVIINTEPVYCDANGNGATDSASFEKIERVIFNTIDNSSTSTDGYEDFTAISTPLVTGEIYNFEASFSGTTFIENQLIVWIDFNQNKVFETSEEVLNTFGQSPWIGNISIPLSALEGSTRMRIRLHDSTLGPNDTPCGTSAYGQVEDYTVEIFNGYIYNDSAWTPNNPVIGAIPSSSSDNISVLNGTANISGELIGNDLTVVSGANLVMDVPASSFSVDATILNLAGDITNDGNITFKSGEFGSAQFDEFTGTISGTGDVTIERYIPAFNNINGTNLGRAFRFLTSTVTTTSSIKDNWQEGVNNVGLNYPTDNQDPNSGFGTHITGSTTGANGFDATPSGNPSMFTFNNASTGTGAQDWAAISGTDGSNKLKAGRAYLTFVRGDRGIDVTDNEAEPTNTTLRSTGQLLTGQVDYVDLVDNMATTNGHYSLVANPYQAVVDYDKVTKSGLTDYIYVWDASVNSRGAYVTVDVIDNSNNFTPDPTTSPGSDANNFLAPGQAFFVQNDAIGNGDLTFNEEDKDTSATQVTVFSTNTDFTIQSGLFRTANLQNGSGKSDGIVLLFNNNYTTLADYEDAVKFDNPDENYAIVNNGLRSIDKQAMPSIGHEIDLSISNFRESNYSLTFDMENKPENMGVFLNDNYLDSQTELSNGDVYDFSVDENIPGSIAEDRFSLSFDNTTLSIDDNVFGDGFSLYPNPTQGQFSIKTPNLSGEVNIEIINLIGQQVSVQYLSVENQFVNVNAENLSSGVYVVKLIQGSQNFSFKLMVE